MKRRIARIVLTAAQLVIQFYLWMYVFMMFSGAFLWKVTTRPDWAEAILYHDVFLLGMTTGLFTGFVALLGVYSISRIAMGVADIVADVTRARLERRHVSTVETQGAVS